MNRTLTLCFSKVLSPAKLSLATSHSFVQTRAATAKIKDSACLRPDEAAQYWSHILKACMFFIGLSPMVFFSDFSLLAACRLQLAALFCLCKAKPLLQAQPPLTPEGLPINIVPFQNLSLLQLTEDVTVIFRPGVSGQLTEAKGLGSFCLSQRLELKPFQKYIRLLRTSFQKGCFHCGAEVWIGLLGRIYVAGGQTSRHNPE